jgi:2'-5' RNA ligase
MNRAAAMEDGAGHRVEILGFDVDQVRDGLGLPRSTSTDEVYDRCRTTGTLGASTVPCLSLEAQLLIHEGYPERGLDRRDVALLSARVGHRPGTGNREPVDAPRPSPNGGTAATPRGLRPTSLVVPVLSVSGIARELRERLDPTAAAGFPPHITVLYPFLPPSEMTGDGLRELSAAFRRIPAFDYQLSSIHWFQPNVVYLAPDRAGHFRRLTEAVVTLFPERQPYEGAFDQVVPHLTIGDSSSSADLRRAASRLRRQLPITATADEVWLMAEDDEGSWLLEQVFRLG